MCLTRVLPGGFAGGRLQGKALPESCLALSLAGSATPGALSEIPGDTLVRRWLAACAREAWWSQALVMVAELIAVLGAQQVMLDAAATGMAHLCLRVGAKLQLAYLKDDVMHLTKRRTVRIESFSGDMAVVVTSRLCARRLTLPRYALTLRAPGVGR